MPMPARRSFTRVFEADAIDQVVTGYRSVSDVSRDLAITDGIPRRWILQTKAHGKAQDAFPDHGRLPAKEDRLRRLRCEVAQLCKERDVLKSAS